MKIYINSRNAVINCTLRWFGSAICLAVMLSIGSVTVHAHATLMPRQAAQDSYQRLTFGITHGCEGAATHTVIVNFPESVIEAKPMPKPGWTIELDIRDLEQPYLAYGKEIKRDVRKIMWKGGSLPDAFYDEFVVQVRVGSKTGLVYLPVTQLCDQGRLDWLELPDGSGTKLIAPAPVLDIVPGTHGPH